MTCVVGETDGRTIILGADSAAGSGDEIYTIDLPKVFARGGFLFGYCGSYRIGQILRYRVELPEPPSGDLEPFLVRELIPALRRAVIEEGAAGEGNAFLGEKTALLIGCQGELWTIARDLTAVPEADFAAIGSGRLRAYAALYALRTAGVEPSRRRLEVALQAAAAFTSTVRPPWHFVSDGGREDRSRRVQDARERAGIAIRTRKVAAVFSTSTVAAAA